MELLQYTALNVELSGMSADALEERGVLSVSRLLGLTSGIAWLACGPSPLFDVELSFPSDLH